MTDIGIIHWIFFVFWAFYEYLVLKKLMINKLNLILLFVNIFKWLLINMFTEMIKHAFVLIKIKNVSYFACLYETV